MGTLRDCGKCCYLWEWQGLKYSLCSCFNLGSTIGNRNNCILATGGFLLGGVPYAETHILYCKLFSSQTLLFPKATFPGLSCALSFSRSSSLFLSLIFFPSLFYCSFERQFVHAAWKFYLSVLGAGERRTSNEKH